MKKTMTIQKNRSFLSQHFFAAIAKVTACQVVYIRSPVELLHCVVLLHVVLFRPIVSLSLHSPIALLYCIVLSHRKLCCSAHLSCFILKVPLHCCIVYRRIDALYPITLLHCIPSHCCAVLSRRILFCSAPLSCCIHPLHCCTVLCCPIANYVGPLSCFSCCRLIVPLLHCIPSHCCIVSHRIVALCCPTLRDQLQLF